MHGATIKEAYGVLVGRKRTVNVHIKCNSDVRSRYGCRSGKSIIITYSECGSVAVFNVSTKCTVQR